MIEKMYKAYIVSRLSEKSQMLYDLRDLGLLHIRTQNTGNVSSEALDRLRDKLSSLQKVKIALDERADKKKPVKQKSLEEALFKIEHEKLCQAIDDIKIVNDNLSKKQMKLNDLSIWGDYDSADYKSIAEKGLVIHFYTLAKKDICKIDKDVKYVVLSPVNGQASVATIGSELKGLGEKEFVIDDVCPSILREEIVQLKKEAEGLEALVFGSVALSSEYNRQIAKVSEEIKFELAREATGEGENLCWITGFIPESGLDCFKKAASADGYAYLIDDVVPEDEPPTKVKYNKVTGVIQPVFDMLGTVPGYYEYDISMWFFMFFALFFAMIIGDGAYGLVFVLVAIALHVKAKKTNNLILLVYVMGISTVIWGAVTGTWFGSRAILENSKFLQALVIPQISNYPDLFGLSQKTAQDTLMQFCFIVGTLQLSLACVMNIVKKVGAKDLSLVADFGWLVMIDALYFLVLMLVLGAEINATAVFGVVAVGFVLVVCFGCQGPGVSFGKGLASGAGGFFTSFLNTISAFGNIMSYIRLFAVGMASLAIAESFNDMAAGFLSGWALPAGVIILVIGHTLNLVMGLLSVIVHGVRLNLLEFSGQLGMAWTGISYEPFCNKSK